MRLSPLPAADCPCLLTGCAALAPLYPQSGFPQQLGDVHYFLPLSDVVALHHLQKEAQTPWPASKPPSGPGTSRSHPMRSSQPELLSLLQSALSLSPLSLCTSVPSAWSVLPSPTPISDCCTNALQDMASVSRASSALPDPLSLAEVPLRSYSPLCCVSGHSCRNQKPLQVFYTGRAECRKLGTLQIARWGCGGF